MFLEPVQTDIYKLRSDLLLLIEKNQLSSASAPRMQESNPGVGHVAPIVHSGIWARLAQSVERQAFNLMVVGSSPTVGVLCKYIKELV